MVCMVYSIIIIIIIDIYKSAQFQRGTNSIWPIAHRRWNITCAIQFNTTYTRNTWYVQYIEYTIRWNRLIWINESLVEPWRCRYQGWVSDLVEGSPTSQVPLRQKTFYQRSGVAILECPADFSLQTGGQGGPECGGEQAHLYNQVRGHGMPYMWTKGPCSQFCIWPVASGDRQGPVLCGHTCAAEWWHVLHGFDISGAAPSVSWVFLAISCCNNPISMLWWHLPVFQHRFKHWLYYLTLIYI